MEYYSKYLKYKYKYLIEIEKLIQNGGNINRIYTIGHSTRDIEDFIKILKKNKIECLIDVRSLPGSFKYPQYNKEQLIKILKDQKIRYFHIVELGGRRKGSTNIHTSIQSNAFSSYADHMFTDEFIQALSKLIKIANKYKTVIMCAEAVYWRCHRRMISDRLAFDGWNVYHLGMGKKIQKHEIWNIARLDDQNRIIYDR